MNIIDFQLNADAAGNEKYPSINCPLQTLMCFVDPRFYHLTCHSSTARVYIPIEYQVEQIHASAMVRESLISLVQG